METFEDWQCIFLQSINVGGEYQELLPVVNQWIDSIILKQELEKPFDESQMPLFIKSTLPNAINQFLCFNYIKNENEIQLLIEFLEHVVNLLQSISLYVESNFIMSISRMFDHTSIFYQQNKSHKIYDKIIDCFMKKKDIINSVLKSIVDDYNLNFVNYFSLIISINMKILQFKANLFECIENTNELADFFMNFIETNQNSNFFMNKKNCDQLFTSFISFLKLMNASKNSNKEKILALFNFFQEMFLTDKIEIQKLSASCLSSLCQNPKQARIICKENSIIDTIISVDIRPEVLKELIPFLQFQIEQKNIDAEDLIKFWDFCQQSPKLNSNEIVIYIFSYAFKCINDSKLIKTFLQSIQSESQFYLNFLSNIINDFQNLNSNISKKCVKHLFNLSLKNENAQKLLLSLVNKKLNNTTFGTILTQLSRKIEEGIDLDFCCSLVERIIKNSTDPLRLLKDEENSINRIIEFIDENNPGLVRVLFNLYLKAGTKPSRQLIESMIKQNSENEVWIFLKKLLENNNYKSGNDYKELLQIAENQDSEHFSMAFLDFLKVLIFKYSKNSFVKNDGYSTVSSFQDQFKVIKEQIPGLDIAFHIYQQCSDYTVMAMSKYFLMKILNNWKINYAVDFLNVQVQETICKFQSENKFYSSYDPLVRSLQIVLDYLNANETNKDPEDFDSPRHFYPENYIKIIINIKNFISTVKSYTIHFDQQKTIRNLKERIAEREGQKPDTIYLSNYQMDKSNCTLAKCGITNNSKIDVKLSNYLGVNLMKSRSKSENQPPSILFKNNQFADILIDLLDENINIINDIVWKILQILPTSQSMLDIFSNEEDLVSSFFKNFNATKNNYKKLYLIQTFAEKENVFTHPEIVDIIFDLFDNTVIKKEIISFISANYHGEDIQNAQEIAMKLIKYLPDEEAHDITVKIFKILENLSENNDISIDDECMNMFESVDETSWNSIVDFIVKLAEKTDSYQSIFDSLESKLTTSIENNKLSLFILKKIIDKIDIHCINSFYQKLINDSQKYCNLIIKKSSQILQKSSLDDYRIFSDILDFICIIVNKYPSLLKYLHFSIDDLFEIGFGLNSNIIQKSIIKILKTFLKSNSTREVYKNKINTKINEMMNYALDDWNYNPSLWIKNEPFAGLKNLGQTCFLNSVIQQLYHLFPVRYFMSTYEFKKDDELKTLQDIFLQMSFSSRSVIDTTTFVKTWHIWEKELLNPNEQQDSVEFFLALINSLPSKITDLFKGELIHFTSGVDTDFQQESPEAFYNLSIAIKDQVDIYSSFDDFIQDRFLSDYKNDDGNLIQLKNCQRISKLPPVLVLQLKRFEYDAQKNLRVKIDDRFEFPFQINIKKYCIQNDENDENNEDFFYDLNGIIIHRGVAAGGHYFSYIKKEDDWWCFNDSSVSKVDESEVLNDAYGMDQTSAYVLFYVKKDFSLIEKNDEHYDIRRYISFTNEFDYLDEIKDVDEIVENNKKFEKSQALFEPDLIDFVEELDDPITNLLFFIRIICHSRNSMKVDQFISDLKEKIQLQGEISNLESTIIKCTDFLSDNVSDIVNVYLNSYPDVFNTNLTEIIIFCFNYLDEITAETKPSKKNEPFTPNPKSFDFFKKIVDQMLDHISLYRKFTPMFNLIRNYISLHPREAFIDGWIDRLNSILEAVHDYSIKKCQKYQKQNMNLICNDIFEALNAIQTFLNQTDSEIKSIKSKFSSTPMNRFYLNSYF